MYKNIMQGRRRQARGTLKERFARFTDDDRRMLDARIDQMLGLLQERYGYARHSAADALTHYLGSYARRGKRRKARGARAWVWAIPAAGLVGLVIAGRFVLVRGRNAHGESAPAAEATPEPAAMPEVPAD